MLSFIENNEVDSQSWLDISQLLARTDNLEKFADANTATNPFISALSKNLTNEPLSHVMANVVSPWLMPFATWKETVELASYAIEGRPLNSSKSVEEPSSEARVLFYHLSDKSLKELSEARDKVLLHLLSSAKHQWIDEPDCIRRALTFPDAGEPELRIALLRLLTEALASIEHYSIQIEEELIELYKEILDIPGDYSHSKGIAADLLGLLFKNSRNIPPQVALPNAVAFMELSLTYFDRQEHPSDSATVYNNLGNALSMMGDLPKSIKYFRKGLEIITINAYPGLYASLSDNLAIALAQLGSGDLTSNIEHAILHNSDALRIWNPEQYEHEWLKASLNHLSLVAHLLTTSPSVEAGKRAISRAKQVHRELFDFYESLEFQPLIEPSIVHVMVADSMAMRCQGLKKVLLDTQRSTELYWVTKALESDDRLQKAKGIELGVAGRLQKQRRELLSNQALNSNSNIGGNK